MERYDQRIAIDELSASPNTGNGNNARNVNTSGNVNNNNAINGNQAVLGFVECQY